MIPSMGHPVHLIDIFNNILGCPYVPPYRSGSEHGLYGVYPPGYTHLTHTEKNMVTDLHMLKQDK
jgi:hypothetical protein